MVLVILLVLNCVVGASLCCWCCSVAARYVLTELIHNASFAYGIHRRCSLPNWQYRSFFAGILSGGAPPRSFVEPISPQPFQSQYQSFPLFLELQFFAARAHSLAPGALLHPAPATNPTWFFQSTWLGCLGHNSSNFPVQPDPELSPSPVASSSPGWVLPSFYAARPNLSARVSLRP